MKPSREGMSRRKFLASVGAGVVAGAVGEGWREKKEKEHAPFVNEAILSELHRSQSEKINFHPVERKRLTPELKTALQQILKLQSERLTNQGSSFEDATTASVDQFEHKELDQEVNTNIQKKVWEALKQFLPDLGEYTETGYATALAYDFPRAMAEYGIFAKPLLYALGNPDSDQMELLDVMYRFYTVDQVISTEVERWGKTVQRDVVYITGVMDSLEQSQFDNLFAPIEAQSMFQNVIVFSKAYRQAGETIRIQIEAGKFDIYKKLTPELLLRTIVREGESQALQAQGIQALIFKRLAEEPRHTREFSERMIEHETGHVVQHSDAEFAEYFQPTPTDQLSKFQVEKFEKSAKDEAAAVINELRYGNHKLASLSYAAQWYENSLERDYPHAKSAHWVIDQITETIQRDPSTYGIQILDGLGSAKTQILLQLPRFIDDPKFLEVMEIVKETFEATYTTESFTQEIQDTFGLRPASGVKEFVCTSVLVGGAALAVLSAVKTKEPKT